MLDDVYELMKIMFTLIVVTIVVSFLVFTFPIWALPFVFWANKRKDLKKCW